MTGQTTIAGADLTEIKVALARIDERTAGQAAAAENRHKDIVDRMNGFVPRSEIEADNRSRDGRIAALEAHRTTVHRVAIGLAGAVLAGLAFLGKLAGATLPSLLQ